jgi:diacylglycerol kinase
MWRWPPRSGSSSSSGSDVVSSSRGGPASARTSWGRLFILGWFLLAFFVSSAPLVLGVIVADLLPGVGGVRQSVTLPILVAALMLIVGLAVVFGSALERLLDRLFPGRTASSRIAKQIASALPLWALLLPLMENGLGAVVATVVAVVLYSVAAPVLDRIDRKREEDDGDVAS